MTAHIEELVYRKSTSCGKFKVCCSPAVELAYFME